MTTPKHITVKWIGGNSLPNPTISPHELMDASKQFIDYLRESGYGHSTTASLYMQWLKSAERIAVEAAKNAVPTEAVEDYVQVVDQDEGQGEGEPPHPTVLSGDEAYDNAPIGTILVSDGSYPLIKDNYGVWKWEKIGGILPHPRKVLRWGWDL